MKPVGMEIFVEINYVKIWTDAAKSKTGPGRDPAVKSDAKKAREEARKRLLSAKAAGRQRKASENYTGDVQIFIS